ncbi:MAG: Yip1 family protein [Tahibacter sp.]
MDFNRLIARVKNILLTPNTEWPVIAAEPASTQSLYTNYILILAAIPAVFGFIKSTIIGIGIPFVGTIRIGMGAGIAQMLLQYGVVLGLTFVLALIIDALASNFGAQKNQVQALKTAAYSYTASWIASVCLIVPWIGWLLAIAGGIYGIYLMYLGLPHTMKSPPEKTGGYLAVIIVIAIVLGWVAGALVASLSGAGAAMNARSALSGSTLSIDSDSGFGKLAAMGAKMEEAGKKLDAAQKSGDTQAQAAAAAAVLSTALSGGDSVEALSPDALKPFIPETLAGLPRTSFSAEKNGAMGMQVSTARATYSDGQQRSVELEITDTGSIKGLVGMAAWAQIEQERQTETGYEKTYKSGGRLIHEQWDNSSKRGEYSMVLGDRFAVKVQGTTDSIETLKGLLGTINLGALEALRNEGVKKG